MLMRSRFAVLTAALAALALSACSSGGGTDDGTSADDGAASAEATTVTITDTLNGDVEVPAAPERVVGLWNVGYQLHEQGVTPVGIMEQSYVESDVPDDYAELSQIPTVGNWDAVDIEAIIELEPDVIVTMDNGTEWDYDALNAIAPTVAFSVAGPTDVWNAYEGVAAAVGKSDAYDELSGSFDQALADIKTEHGDALAEAQAVYVDSYQEGAAYVYTTRGLAAPRIEAAGFAYDTSWDEKAEWYGYDLDFELLDELSENDVLFYPAAADGSVADEFTQAMLDEPAFQDLPAVQAGHLYPYRSLFVYTFAAAQLQAEDLAAAAADYTS